jgi:hypothetical protein
MLSVKLAELRSKLLDVVQLIDASPPSLGSE